MWVTNEIEVKVEPDGWWTWECKTHGKAAFLHKTARDAKIEAAQHNEAHAFSSRVKVDIWAVGADRVTTTTDMVSGLITNTHRVNMPPCIDEKCKAIRERQHANGLDYYQCYTQPREMGHAYDC